MKTALLELSNIEQSSDLALEPALRDGFSLGNNLVYPNKGSIVKNQEHHHLSYKAMEVLYVLACNAGRVVSRQALIEYIWGVGHVSDSKLSHLMTEIRHLLDDHKEHPTYIQTLPRKGFRLLLPALPLEHALLSSEGLRLAEKIEKQGSGTSNKGLGFNYWRQSRLFKIAGTYVVMSWVLMQVVSVTLPIISAAGWLDKLALLILIGGFPLVLLYNWWIEFKLRLRFVRKHHNAQAEAQISQRAYQVLSIIGALTFCCLVLAFLLASQIFQSVNQAPKQQSLPQISAQVYDNAVAVMPFKQQGNQKTEGVIGLLQSELLGFLSQSTQLRVISDRVLASLAPDASLQTIREWTGARYVLEGTVSIQGELTVVSTSFTDTQSGYQVWSNKTSMQQGEQLKLQETISHQVVNALTFLMPQDESSKLQFKPTEDIHAYDFYVRGKAILREAYNQAQLKQAEELFLNALSRDSHFELAKAGLCQTYIEQYDLMKMSQIFELARQSCQATLSDNNIKAESEIALGRLYFASGEYQRSRGHFTQALALQANNSLALTGLAQVLARQDQTVQAEQHFLNAIQVEPGYWRNYEVYGSFLFALGKYFEASLQFYKQSILQPNSEEAFNSLGAAYYLNAEFNKATESWRKALSIRPSANIYSNLGTSLFFAKKFDEAAKMYQQAVLLSPGNFVIKGNFADAVRYAGGAKTQTNQLYMDALNQARDSETVNEHDLYLKAGIARYYSELSYCKEANSLSEKVVAANPDDPYIYYDLALVAINCADKKAVSNALEVMLKLGYPPKLLSNDPQFYQYQQRILQLQIRHSGMQQ